MRFVCTILTVLLLSTAAFAEPMSVTTFVGSDGGPGYRDGAGSAARFALLEGLAVDPSGNIVVVDSGARTIRHITPAGVVTTLAGVASEEGATDGKGGVARFSSAKAIAIDGAGNIYVADAGLRKISTSGVSPEVTTLVASIPATIGIAVDSSGNIFLTDPSADSIRKITPGGTMTTFVATADEPRGLTIDGSNNLYFTSAGGGVYKCTPLGDITTVGTVSGATYLDVDASGNLYVSAAGRIVKVTSAGVVTEFAGSFQGHQDGTGTAAGFSAPNGVALSPDGSLLYVAEFGNHTVRKVTVSGAVVTTLAGKANPWGMVDATGLDARFSGPVDAVLAPDGNLYAADSGNSRIRKITPAGVATTFAGGTYGSEDGGGTSAQFQRPARVAVGYDGPDWVLYVADSGTGSIRRITQAGVVTTLATGFSGPYGIAVAPDGAIYVSEYGGHTIRKIDMPAATVTLFAGEWGTSGHADGTGTAARFRSPAGLSIDGSGNLYVADSMNHRIRRIVLATAEVTTLAGNSLGMAIDGTGTAAGFHTPFDVHAIGNDLYVADGHMTLRLIEPGAVVTTVAGAPIRYANVDGTGDLARFAQITGIAGDSNTNLYLCDNGGRNIRKARVPGIADVATTFNSTVDPHVPVQLHTDPNTATSWTWSLVRRPKGSAAQPSSTTIRNPRFTPDVEDLYTFLLRAEGPGGVRYSTVSVTAASCPDPLSSVVATTGLTGVCVSGSPGSARVDVTGGMGVVSYQWGYRTTSGGPITPIPFESGAVYSVDGPDLGGIGMRYLVATVTPTCGVPTVSNELPLEVTPVPDPTVSASSGVFANSTGNFASVADAGPGASYHWSINYGFALGTITAGQGTRSITYNAGSTEIVQLMAIVYRYGCQVDGHASMSVQPRPAGATMLYVVTPCRVVDTRDTTAIADGETRNFLFAGVCGIPSDASAVVTNVTAVSPSTDGWVALRPAGIPWGGTSTMNYRTGRTRANNGIVPLSNDGYVSVLNSGTPQHVIIDVTGYFR